MMRLLHRDLRQKRLFINNIFTYFNLIFLVIAVLLLLVGAFRDLTFLPVIICNTLIGIIQEIRSKKVLDKLSVLNAPKATVVREGKLQTESARRKGWLLDDVVKFQAGNQICADATVIDGEVQVNESLLTGESDEITKKPGDTSDVRKFCCFRLLSCTTGYRLVQTLISQN